ncbi:endonuclease [Lysobacter sp. A3-1-A15]|uniref:endonuclease n=1 Tax=Novilysobacter viscosus TaxID=3098602 RepID=UPI002ED97EDD
MGKIGTRLRAGLFGLVALATSTANAGVFINEFHYDNNGTDTNEKIEVIAPAGTSMTGWKIALYNGSNRARYATLSLSGTVADQCGGYGTAVVAAPGMQNGAPDGLALIDANGTLVQFLSYEGSFTASDGPAAGRTSTMILPSETSTTPVGYSLQLSGSGAAYADFSWQSPRAHSFGACNAGQSFSGGSTPPPSPAPTGYYSGVNTSSAANLRATLHAVIDDHKRFPYTSTATDTWDVLEFADEDPLNANRILDIYKNASYAEVGGGNTYYNREHTWPKSYGFPTDGAANYPYTDMHMLMLSDSSYNSSRGNKPYGNCTSSCTEYPTQSYAGQGGGSGVFPGNSNWANSSIWQTWGKLKGNVARALLYMDVRYEGGKHNVTGVNEPDLRLTNDLGLIKTTSGNASIAYMGLLSVLLQWHAADPVTEAERMRNDAIYSYQGNRNPFIDHPEWVACVYQNVCN